MDNNDFVRSVESATAKIILQIAKNMDKARLVIENEAKKNCPVDQGLLRASIHSKTAISTDEIVGEIGSNLDYAPYVHNGTGVYAKDGKGRKTQWKYVAKSGKYKGGHTTSGQKPQPFLEDAKLSCKDRISKMLGD